jgi:hypothetical protein
MSFSLTTPLTGGTVSGLTTPTYTLQESSGPTPKSKQYYVSALGGTQTGVAAHSVAKPFTISFIPPGKVKALGSPNPITGVIKSIPDNRYKLLTRKGMQPATDQTDRIGRMSTVWEIPAGAETYEPEEIRAMASAHIGALIDAIDGIVDTLVSGEA